MGRIALLWKAELENLSNLIPANKAEYDFPLKVKCTSCNEVHSKHVTVNGTDKTELPGSRGESNFVWKCSFCSKVSSANVELNTIQPYMADDSGQFKQLVVFECRGCEFVGFEPRDGFEAEGAESGTKFDDIDLSEGEWVEYDEKSKLPVGISEVGIRFEKA
jgi:hypothetical protein